MSELRLVVDHLRFKYSGPFDAKALYSHITAFLKERGFDFETMKEFELDTKKGKQIEWHLRPWKQISDYTRYLVRIRVLIHDYTKIEAIVDKKKVKIGNGRVVINLDGFAELDQQNRWEGVPFFQFLRALYNNFIFRVYTERFEQRLSYDTHHLYYTIEQFFNVYKHYKVVSRVPPFVSAH